MSLLPERLPTWRPAAYTGTATTLWLLVGPRVASHADYVVVLFVAAAVTAGLWLRHLTVRDRYRQALTDRDGNDMRLWRWTQHRPFTRPMPDRPTPEEWNRLHRQIIDARDEIDAAATHLPTGLADRLHVAVEADLLRFLRLADRNRLRQAEVVVAQARHAADELRQIRDHNDNVADADIADVAAAVLAAWRDLETVDHTTPTPEVARTEDS